MFNCTDNFVHALIQELLGTGGGDWDTRPIVNIIKQHTGDQLATAGDYSFPLAAQRWGVAIRAAGQEFPPEASILDVSRIRDKPVGECLDELVSAMQPMVARMSLSGERVLVFLNRALVFDSIYSVLKAGSDYGREPRDSRCIVVIRDEGEGEEMSDRSITEYRCRLVRQALVNMVGYSKYLVGEDDEKAQLRWFVSHRSSGKGTEKRAGVNILCGVVRDAGQKGNKMADMKSGEYIR